MSTDTGISPLWITPGCSNKIHTPTEKTYLSPFSNTGVQILNCDLSINGNSIWNSHSLMSLYGGRLISVLFRGCMDFNWNSPIFPGCFTNGIHLRSFTLSYMYIYLFLFYNQNWFGFVLHFASKMTWYTLWKILSLLGMFHFCWLVW